MANQRSILVDQKFSTIHRLDVKISNSVEEWSMRKELIWLHRSRNCQVCEKESSEHHNDKNELFKKEMQWYSSKGTCANCPTIQDLRPRVICIPVSSYQIELGLVKLVNLTDLENRLNKLPEMHNDLLQHESQQLTEALAFYR